MNNYSLSISDNKFIVEEEKLKFKNREELLEFARENGYDYNEVDINELDYNETEWVIWEIPNPENEQKLIQTIIPVQDASYYEAKKELTETTSYHDWSDTIADKIEDLENEIEKLEEELEDFNFDNCNDLETFNEQTYYTRLDFEELKELKEQLTKLKEERKMWEKFYFRF